MVDVGRDDRPARGHLVADELGGDEGGDARAEIIAVRPARLGALGHALPPEVLAVRDVAHLLGDDASAGELQLRHGPAGLAHEHGALGGAGRHETVRGGEAVVLGPHGARHRGG